MKIKEIAVLLVCILGTTLMHTRLIAQRPNTPKGFKVIPLGVLGGLDESNLSAYMVAANGSNAFICLDAGTINAGLIKASQNKLFAEKNASLIQQENIKAYFISHGHLDHLAGLILNSPNDISKPVYALPSVIDVLKSNYFTWKGWANFANEGEAPALGKYQYQYLTAGQAIEVPTTGLTVTGFSLSHVNPYESTAFLVHNNNDYLLYLGDTGADTVERSNKLWNLWTQIAPLIKNKQLKAIFIEVSFDNSLPDKSLFGHLNPKLFMEEMNKLHGIAGENLKELTIAVTHIKPCSNCTQNIQAQIKEGNHLGLKIIYPAQGQLISIP